MDVEETTYAFNDWIISSCNRIEFLILGTFEDSRSLGAALFVSLVVGIQETAPEQIFFLERHGCICNILANLFQVHINNHLPLRLDSNRCLTINPLPPVVVSPWPVPSTTSATAPTATLGLVHLKIASAIITSTISL